MSEHDPLLSALRDLPAPPLDARASARARRRAERVLMGAEPYGRWRPLGVFALPALMLASEALYIVQTLGLALRVFG